MTVKGETFMREKRNHKLVVVSNPDPLPIRVIRGLIDVIWVVVGLFLAYTFFFR